MALYAKLRQEFELFAGVYGDNVGKELPIHLSASRKNNPLVEKVIPEQLKQVRSVSKHPDFSEIAKKSCSIFTNSKLPHR